MTAEAKAHNRQLCSRLTPAAHALFMKSIGIHEWFKSCMIGTLSFLVFLIVGMLIIGDITLRRSVFWLIAPCLAGVCVAMIVFTVLKVVARKKGYKAYLAAPISQRIVPNMVLRKDIIKFLDEIYFF